MKTLNNGKTLSFSQKNTEDIVCLKSQEKTENTRALYCPHAV